MYLIEVVQRLSDEGWKMDELRSLKQGMVRYQAIRERAENFRSEAMKKATENLENLQTKLLAFLGLAARKQVEQLSQELTRLVRRIDKHDKDGKAHKSAK